MIISPTNHLKYVPELNRPLTALKGIGPKRAEIMAQKGLHTLMDLLMFRPIRYEDRRQIVPINKTSDGLAIWVRGNAIFGREERFYRSGKRLFRIRIKDETGIMDLLWFQYKKAHLSKLSRQGLDLMAYGLIQRNRGKAQMIHPDIALPDLDKRSGLLRFYPVYSALQGVSGHIIRSTIMQVLDQYHKHLVDPIPREITRKLALPDLADAIRCIHVPPKKSSIDLLNQLRTKYHQRLTFDRFFCVMLGIALRKRSRKSKAGPAFSIPKALLSRVEKYFPFSLTGGQVSAIEGILKDLGSGKPMNRLLLGDVGCGKTVVAVVAAFVTILNGWQVAVMVPTQILARQHYLYFASLPESMGFRPVCLTGALKKHERLDAYEKISNGEYNLIVGTQALIQEALSFYKLGLVVIDEQQRFGVRQRALLDQKGTNAHLLVMTATPIPRTLAMTVYADLDISLIKEFPEGRQPVITRLMDGSQKRKVFDMLNQKMAAAEQAMVICPVIEQSEETDLKNALEMHRKLKKIFVSRFRVGLIHGRMSNDEKDLVMEQFRKGLIDLLVGTTVIEVGVDVPRATVMVIQHPERFGLTQLHQLRGRVGRGTKGGYCFLMVSTRPSAQALSRLEILIQSHDGFEIAQKDLEMRGQGELMGIRQAGAGELDLTEMFREPELLLAAKRKADMLVDSDPALSRPENYMLRKIAQSSYGAQLDF
ncbi:MAG: ATP-dependent DNA helicase RecG [Desulfobacteraceae bacterium]|nr:MAG: ATP-dependent DNA helicase RecG [Desulfobacteraceae bacterium]